MSSSLGASFRAAVAALCLALCAALAGCDPCFGVVQCHTDSHVSYTGRVIDFATGRGSPGVTVTFTRTGGVETSAATLTTVTDADGHFRLSTDASGDGQVVGNVTIAPPSPVVPHTIADVRMSTSRVGGGGGVLDTWTAQPYVLWVGSVVSRKDGAPLPYGTAIFKRTGGARLAGGDSLQVSADVSGYFYLQATALDTGAVIGNMYVNGTPLVRLHMVPNVALPVQVVDHPPRLDRVLAVGTSFNYAVELHTRGTDAPLANADIDFRRTGGPALDSAVVHGRTGADGRVRLDPPASVDAPGVLVGDLTVRSPTLKQPFVIKGIQLPSFDSDEIRFLGVFGVGYAVQTAGELYSRGAHTDIPGADVTFVPTGGVPVPQSSYVTQSLPNGWFGLNFVTDTNGPVIGDLSVRLPGAATPTVFHGVRFQATANDSVQYAGKFSFGAQIAYVGVLLNRGTGTAAVGYSVTFHRTGGIHLLVDTTRAAVESWGGFGISPPTAEEGTVTGTLTAHEPGTGRDIPLGAVTLETLASDTVRLAGTWGVGPSLLYVGELRRADTGQPIVGAVAEFRRTGGIATADTSAGEASNADGRFRMALKPLAAGDVIGDLYVHPPAPLRDTVYRSIRLPTFETDEVKLAGVWFVAPPQ